MNNIGAQILGSGGIKKKGKDNNAGDQAASNPTDKNAAAGKVKVNISGNTERGEAGIVASGVAIPSGITNKSNLAMAGGNILGDKSSFMK